MASSNWLKDVSIFKDLPDEGLKTINDALEKKNYEPGEVVYTENERGGNLYIIKSGEVRVYRKPGAKNMSEVELARLKANGIFGELSFLDESVHTANIAAVDSSEVYVLAKVRFEEIAEVNPRVAYLVTRNLLLVIESIIRKMNADYVSTMEYLYVFGK